jgi:hypothetical protein
MATRKAAVSTSKAATQKLENNGSGFSCAAVIKTRRCSGDKTPVQSKAIPTAAENAAMAQLVETDLIEGTRKPDSGSERERFGAGP